MTAIVCINNFYHVHSEDKHITSFTALVRYVTVGSLFWSAQAIVGDSFWPSTGLMAVITNETSGSRFAIEVAGSLDSKLIIKWSRNPCYWFCLHKSWSTMRHRSAQLVATKHLKVEKTILRRCENTKLWEKLLIKVLTKHHWNKTPEKPFRNKIRDSKAIQKSFNLDTFKLGNI